VCKSRGCRAVAVDPENGAKMKIQLDFRIWLGPDTFGRLMSENTLNRLILLSALLTIGGFFVISGNLIGNEAAMKYFRYLYVLPFSMTPLLLICKLVSRVFLEGLKGQPISSMEYYYVLFYLLLTKEARAEWVDFIEESKKAIQGNGGG
jgi:hypothetical protein